jgi:transposase-like protein
MAIVAESLAPGAVTSEIALRYHRNQLYGWRRERFGSPLVLSRVHWVRPEMLAEVSYVELRAAVAVDAGVRGSDLFRSSRRTVSGPTRRRSRSAARLCGSGLRFSAR